jgi:hypothetical protein
MSGYFYKGVPVNQVIDINEASLSISNFSPLIYYKTKTNASGNNNIISLPYNNTTNIIPYNFLIRTANGTTLWLATAYWSGSDPLVNPGTTNSNNVLNLNAYVNNTSYNYSKVRCVLIGGSAGGGGADAANSRATGSGGGSGAYLSFDLMLDNPHPSSTLTLTAGGSGNGGQGANRSGGSSGVGGVGQAGGSGAASTLSYYSGVNNRTSTFSANGGIRANRRDLVSPGGTVSISSYHTYNTIYSLNGKEGSVGSYGGAFGTGGNGPLVGTINQTNSYNYGSDNVPSYITTEIPGFTGGVSWTNSTIATTADGTNYGGAGGHGGYNYNTNYGYGGMGGTGGFARIYFFVDP